jgi:ABC-type proline/glycine betaine transport system substrate-binding protein
MHLLLNALKVLNALNARKPPMIHGRSMVGCIGVLLIVAALSPVRAAEAEKSQPVAIAVFAFELEDASPAAALMGKTTSSAAAMDKVSSEARRMLAQSGRYNLIDVSQSNANPVKEKSLRNCDGCEAGIALKLGAEESLLGVVTRVTQTDYYVAIRIRDAHTGKILDQQEANFAGGDDGWASGVRMLIKHQILAQQE